MARPRTPTQLKIVKGTKQNCRTNKAEPNPGGWPVMPAHFGEAEKAAWELHLKLLGPMKVLTVADAGALEALCLAYVTLVEAYRQLRDEGLTQMSDTGLRKHPAAGIAAEQNRIYQSWLAKFGLSPADRSRVSTIPGAPEQSGWAKVKNG